MDNGHSQPSVVAVSGCEDVSPGDDRAPAQVDPLHVVAVPPPPLPQSVGGHPRPGDSSGGAHCHPRDGAGAKAAADGPHWR